MEDTWEVVCIGEMILDMFAAETGRGYDTVTAFLPVAGGAPANVAAAAAKQGRKSAFIGKVGDDPFGRRLAAALSENGVETRGMRFDSSARTTLNFMTIPNPNTVETLFYRNPGADMMLRPDELDRGLIEGARFFHFGSVSLTEEPCRSATFEAARIAKAAGVPVSFDVNYRPSIWPEQRALPEIRRALGMADVVKVNELELELLAGSGSAADPAAGCARLLEAGPRLCVVTLGPKGCAYATREARATIKGFTVKTVDATGCGDAFTAALLCRLIAAGAGSEARKTVWGHSLGRDALEESLLYANASGALTATKKGVIPALPLAREVEAFVAHARRDSR
jgi:fructokinase